MKPDWLSDGRLIPDEVMSHLRKIAVHAVEEMGSTLKELKDKHGNTDLVKLQTYVAMQSNGMPWNPPMDHPLEKAMRAGGEEFFYRRASISDFSCATCHAATGKRIRASMLPNANVPEEWTMAISWPAFRVGHRRQ